MSTIRNSYLAVGDKELEVESIPPGQMIRQRWQQKSHPAIHHGANTPQQLPKRKWPRYHLGHS